MTQTRRTVEEARTWFAQVRASGESDQPVPAGSAAARWRRMSPEARELAAVVFDDLLEALRVDEEYLLRATCPACLVSIGETHADDCDVAECLATGWKRMVCRARSDGDGHDCGAATWTGEWPGHRECREFGWHVQWDAETAAWSRCSPDVAGSGPDLTRLYAQARWNADERRWVRRRAVVFTGALSGGRAAVEELAKVAQRFCVEQGYEVVCEHAGSRSWRAAVADVADGKAEVVVVPSVERLGHGRQVFERIRQVREVGGTIAGPGVELSGTSLLLAASLPDAPAD